MFSDHIHCIYTKNQLAEVICQLRFPEILSIETNIPDRFQDAIRDQFPLYSVRKEVSGEHQINNYQFASQNGAWRVNLTSRFISLTCSRYTSWEEFASMLDRPLAVFIQVYKPAFFERVGLRYINLISKNSLQIPHLSFRDLIEPAYLGILSNADLPEQNVIRSLLDGEIRLTDGCNLKLHAGTAKVSRNGKTDPETKFVLDQDLYMLGQIAVNSSAASLQTLHSHAFTFFRSAITETLHNSMEPISSKS